MTVASGAADETLYAHALAAFARSHHRGPRRRALAIACLLLGVPAIAADGDSPQVIVTTRIVMASNNGTDNLQGADTRPLRESLQLFPYSSYKLLQHEVRPVSMSKMVRYPLPGERHLLVQPTEFKNGRVSLQVMLMQERKVLVNTALKLKDGGEFVVAGPQYEDGVLFLAIGAQMQPSEKRRPEVQRPGIDGFHHASDTQ